LTLPVLLGPLALLLGPLALLVFSLALLLFRPLTVLRTLALYRISISSVRAMSHTTLVNDRCADRGTNRKHDSRYDYQGSHNTLQTFSAPASSSSVSLGTELLVMNLDRPRHDTSRPDEPINNGCRVRVAAATGLLRRLRPANPEH